MRPQHHRIKRQVLELTVADPEGVHQLQEEVSRIFRRRLVPILDTYCTALSTPERVDRIDTLEIDLGTLDLGSLEDDMVDRFTRQLPRALSERMARDDEQPSKDRAVTSISTSQLELFAFFARNGRLPWWADPSRPHHVDEALEYLIQRAPRLVQQLIRGLARESRPLRRIVASCNDRILTSLLFALAPKAVRPVPDLAEMLLTALRAAPPLAGQTITRLRTVFWQAALGLASQYEPTTQDPLDFWRTLLVQVARRSGLSPAAMVRSLPDAAPEAGSSQLREAVAQLRRELGDRESPVKHPEPDVLKPGAEDRNPDTAAERAERYQKPSKDEPGLTGRVEEEPSQPDVLKPGAKDRKPEITVEQTQQLERRPKGEPGLTRRVKEEPLDPGFSDSEEAHVPNAGLVLLWPFLGRFFEQLGLTEEKSFKDPAARHRAVGLLGYLAHADPEPAEYLLPLAKVLCGMDLDEVFDFGSPVTEAEAEECSNLLRAVISHAAILNDMSVDGFRGSFLIRQGLLDTRDGAWLLRVERQTYDIVLERFPWTWVWVKQPWMEAPLRVEW